ncbi:Uncharacterised protein [Vibrio fluvialis]|uniref:Uncharacterized protein n=1 Tax=Vibrio fluvialis TaxID=676 RepID=A0AAX2LJI5_VIBFL|nr:Uncharacterised protein [Vibrio fluvialis]
MLPFLCLLPGQVSTNGYLVRSMPAAFIMYFS